MSTFSNPQHVAHYADGPVRQVPGLQALHQMASLLLAEKVPEDGQVLVLGAGGGLELKTFALAHPGWRFLGVDPSAEMLGLARQTLGDLLPRATLHEGYIDTAPDDLHDGATCLLTLHFLDAAQRLQTLRQLARRLKPGAPLVVAHHSFPQVEPDKTRWLQRYAAFAESNGVNREQAQSAIGAIASRLPLISAEEDEAILRQAGFEGVELFYAGFTFKGWVGHVAGL
ncbi:class I SAM-dependent methyltransferase [Pseudomonas maumuensis]|uniref:Class I SAM-dependent methyltransferase n=1 Tax=Pseudomonas maumuensis TaxID=2842354 RepID=A0ABX8NRR5_9PSED|nr:class I SAM-dependent methyltransferase [Pseudomonas maumuensis]QXH58790.1 class I SAM-dependent methyltransferase [Pseudomonas maumuensis]